MKQLRILAALLVILVINGCNKYYMPATTNLPDIRTIKNHIAEKRHFILRDSIFVYEMSNVQLNDAANEISCNLQVLSGLKTLYNSSHSKKNYYYKPARPDSLVQNEIHLHTSHALTNGLDIQKTIPLAAIMQMEELNFDKRKTSRHNLAIGLGVTAGVAAIVAVIGSITIVQEMSDWGN